MTDWSPTDPDEVRVVYDLSAWSVDQQAELAGELAEAEVPHAWDGSDLLVPEDAEQAADLVIADVEARLGIENEPEVEGGLPDEALGPIGNRPAPIHLSKTADVMENDLSEWPPKDLMLVTTALTWAQIPFAWEGKLLLVDAADDAPVEELLGQIERGEYIDPEGSAGGDDDDRLPFETLTTFFLAGERLRNDPLDPVGIEHLIAATELADPATPPYGVAPRLWERVCELADQLADALVGPDDDTDDTGDDTVEEEAEVDLDEATEELDYDRATDTAAQLHDLLRPYV